MVLRDGATFSTLNAGSASQPVDFLDAERGLGIPAGHCNMEHAGGSIAAPHAPH
jgi:hypothetical protein